MGSGYMKGSQCMGYPTPHPTRDRQRERVCRIGNGVFSLDHHYPQQKEERRLCIKKEALPKLPGPSMFSNDKIWLLDGGLVSRTVIATGYS